MLNSKVAKSKGVESDLHNTVLKVQIELHLLLVEADQISVKEEAYPTMELAD